MFCWPWTWGWTWDPGAEHRPPASPALCGSHPPAAAWGQSAAQETHHLNIWSMVLVLLNIQHRKIIIWTSGQNYWFFFLYHFTGFCRPPQKVQHNLWAIFCSLEGGCLIQRRRLLVLVAHLINITGAGPATAQENQHLNIWCTSEHLMHIWTTSEHLIHIWTSDLIVTAPHLCPLSLLQLFQPLPHSDLRPVLYYLRKCL